MLVAMTFTGTSVVASSFVAMRIRTFWTKSIGPWPKTCEKRLGHGLRAEARLAHLGQHDFESLTQGVARRQILDHGLPQEVEEPERAGVGCGDVAADKEHVGAAVAAGEAHQALGQRAMILASRLSDRRFGLTERVREPRRHDD